MRIVTGTAQFETTAARWKRVKSHPGNRLQEYKNVVSSRKLRLSAELHCLLEAWIGIKKVSSDCRVKVTSCLL